MSSPSAKPAADKPPVAGKPPPSRRRKWLFRLLSVGLALLLGAVVTEVFFRVLERRDEAKTFSEGEGALLLTSDSSPTLPGSTVRAGLPQPTSTVRPSPISPCLASAEPR